MQTSTTHSTDRGSAASFRELTPAETDHVSGGIAPVLIVAVIIATAVLQESCSGDDDSGGAQDED